MHFPDCESKVVSCHFLGVAKLKKFIATMPRDVYQDIAVFIAVQLLRRSRAS